MDREHVRDWVERYIVAWESDDPADVADLFTEDARYLTGPFDEAWEGRDAIVREWVARGDSGTEFGFAFDVMAVAGDLGIVTAETVYPDHTYRNIWFVRLTDDGRASEFSEWWVESPETRKKRTGG
jgi:ketosteroid isomerase-like protein